MMSQMNFHSQQDVQFTNFEFNQAYNNPAFISSTKNICGNIIGRNQWQAINGNPNTAFMNIYTKIDDHSYAGIQLLTDDIGFQHSNLVKLSYAYKINTSKASISFGLNGNLFQSKWSGNYITPDTPQQQDNAIPHQGYSNTKFDLDFGLMISNGKVYAALSTTHLNQTDFSQTGVIGYQTTRHYFVQAGWEKIINGVKLAPKILAKSDVASTQIDFQFQSTFRNIYIIGLNYRISDAISPMIGANIVTPLCAIKLIYAYDITTSQLSNYSKGTHEISVHFCISKKHFTERYTDPRNLGNYDFGPRGKW